MYYRVQWFTIFIYNQDGSLHATWPNTEADAARAYQYCREHNNGSY